MGYPNYRVSIIQTYKPYTLVGPAFTSTIPREPTIHTLVPLPCSTCKKTILFVQNHPVFKERCTKLTRFLSCILFSPFARTCQIFSTEQKWETKLSFFVIVKELHYNGNKKNAPKTTTATTSATIKHKQQQQQQQQHHCQKTTTTAPPTTTKQHQQQQKTPTTPTKDGKWK